MPASSSVASPPPAPPPYLLFSLVPLPCVPVALRRSVYFDLAVSTVVLFGAFLLHDGLQETMYHSLRLRAPVFITALDFIGCAVWGGMVMRFMGGTADKQTAAAAARLASSVQIELVHVRSGHESDSAHATQLHGGSDLSARSRGPRSAVHGNTSTEIVTPATPSSAVAPPARIPLLHYFAIGSMILLSNFLGIYSLSFVDYPLKVVIRSSKLIPTMLIGRLVLKKRYGAMHYLAACTLCLGVILFSLADAQPMQRVSQSQTAAPVIAAAAADGARRLFEVASNDVQLVTSSATASAAPLELSAVLDGSSPPPRAPESLLLIGVVLLSCSVIVDAINPNIAELFIKPARSMTHAAPSSAADGQRDVEGAPLLRGANNAVPSSHGHGHGTGSDPHSVNRFMFHTNAVMLPLLLVAVVLSGELPAILARVVAAPSLLLLFALYSTCSYMGVNAYTSMIKRHGSVLTVGMATLRKICTIVLSYLFIGGQSAAPATPTSLTHPLDTVVVVPEKHFGVHHLLPSALILCGLLLSAWIERGKHSASSAAATATPAPISASSAALPDADDHGPLRRSHSAAIALASAVASTNATGNDNSSALSSANEELRLLAAELGLETEGETDCDTDAEQGNERASRSAAHAQAQAATAIAGRGTMAKHAPRILLDDDDFI